MWPVQCDTKINCLFLERQTFCGIWLCCWADTSMRICSVFRIYFDVFWIFFGFEFLGYFGYFWIFRIRSVSFSSISGVLTTCFVYFCNFLFSEFCEIFATFQQMFLMFLIFQNKFLPNFINNLVPEASGRNGGGVL